MIQPWRLHEGDAVADEAAPFPADIVDMNK